MTGDKKVNSIAVFDFDGTIIRGRTRVWFYKKIVSLPRFIFGMTTMVTLILLVKMKFLSESTSNYLTDKIFLTGLTREFLDKAGEEFVDEFIVPAVKQSAIKCLKEHQTKGHLCILLSGALDVYLKPWANGYNFDKVICTELEFNQENICTSRVKYNQYCTGKHKLELLKNAIIDREKYIIYGYGDSPDDQFFLDYVDYAHYRSFDL